MATPVLTPALIDGTDVTDGEVTEVRSPFDGRVVGLVPSLTTDHVDRAVAVALERHRGPQLPAHQRAEILERAAVLLTERNEEFGQSISAESAKPITTARIEASRAVDTLRFSAVQARTLVGEMVAMDATPAGVGKLGYVKRVPIGVIGAISPFNFPLNLVCHKIAPALAAGCPVVLKPASATPLTALKIARLFEEAGLPPGWLNVVTCPGSVADRLVTHDDVAMITFTGSPEVGWGIRARGARKRVSLELGNNAPVVVEADADLELAATKIVAGGFAFSGQTCISVQRVYVHSSVHDELLDLVTGKVEQLVVGDPADDATVVSALIASKETKRVKEWIDEAVAAGARLVVGGDLTPDEVLKPTVLDNVTADMKLAREETFGPLAGVIRFHEEEEAIRLANDSEFGLASYFYARDISRVWRVAEAIEAGMVGINTGLISTEVAPFGGVKQSGLGREGSKYGLEDFLEVKYLCMGI